MRQLLIKSTLILATYMACACRTNAQDTDADTIIDLLAEKILAHYVLPERRQGIVDRLQARRQSGAYKGMTPNALTDAITEDLATASKDIHLRVTYSPDQYRSMREGHEEDTAAIDAYWQQVMANDNAGIESIKWLPGNVAYMKFTGFWASRDAYDKMNGALAVMRNANALIWDLRENRGGEGAMVQYLTSLFIDEPEPRLLNIGFDGMTNRKWQDYSLSYMPVEKLVGVPLYVLTSTRTFSAGEAFAYHVRNFNLGTLVGETTAGAGFIVQDLALSDGIILHISTGTGTHPVTQTSWEGVGVIPHIPTSAGEAYGKALNFAYTQLADHAKDPSDKAHFLWYADNAKARQEDNWDLIEEDLASFVGSYGQRQIAVANQRLVYSRGDDNWRALYPIDKNTFLIEGFEDFRMSFVKMGDKLTMELYSVEGGESAFPKS